MRSEADLDTCRVRGRFDSDLFPFGQAPALDSVYYVFLSILRVCGRSAFNFRGVPFTRAAWLALLRTPAATFGTAPKRRAQISAAFYLYKHCLGLCQQTVGTLGHQEISHGKFP